MCCLFVFVYIMSFCANGFYEVQAAQQAQLSQLTTIRVIKTPSVPTHIIIYI